MRPRFSTICSSSENCGLDTWSGQTEEIACDPGEEITIPDCGFVREGRTFTGWATSPNGLVEYNAGDKVVMDDDLQLYAIWDGPPRFMVDEYGNLEYVELNGSGEFHIPDTVKWIGSGAFDDFPAQFFNTNSIPCLKLLDGWVVGVTEDYWNIYGTGENDAPYWDLDLSGIRGIVDGTFWGDVRVSSLVASQPVLDYGVSALFGRSVASVAIAEGATNILQHSLSGLEGLTNVAIASSVVRMEQHSFDGCGELPVDTNTIAGVRMVDGWVVGISDDFRNFPERFLNWDLDLTGARGVADYAFTEAAGALHSVAIPASLEAISESAFADSGPLAGFQVDPANARYSAANGLLLEDSGTRLVCVPCGLTSVKIPEGVSEIASYAFRGCGLLSVTVPQSVTMICPYAFAECCVDWLVFDGNAPEAGNAIFDGGSGIGTVYVQQNSTGWNVEIPGRWNQQKIEYIDSILDINCGTLSWIDARGVFSVKVPYGVTRISSSAFSGWIEHVEIPATVTHIEQGAFSGCGEQAFDTTTIPGVRMVDGWVVGFSDEFYNFPDRFQNWHLDLTGARGIADYALAYNDRLVSLAIPDGVVNIGVRAFFGNANLATVSIGGSVERIGAEAFDNCSESLYDVSTVSGARLVDGWAIGWNASSGATTLNLDNVRGIADGAFSGNSSVTSVCIGNTLRKVGAHAFDGCNESIYTSASGALLVDGWVVGYSEPPPNGVLAICGARGIAAEAFAWNPDISCVSADETLAVICQSAFEGCSNLSSASLETGIEQVCNNAFASCNESLYDTATSPGATLVDGWAVGYGESDSDTLILGGVRGIADWAFANSRTLKSVTMQDGVERIGTGAFFGCGNLANAVVPVSVKRICRFAFDGCGEALFDTTTVPGVRIVDGWAVGVDETAKPEGRLVMEGVRGIADGALSGCAELADVEVPNSVVAIGHGAFSGCGAITNMVLPFVGSRRGNSYTPDSLFGWIFGEEPYPGGIAVRQEYRQTEYATRGCHPYSATVSYEIWYFIPERLEHVTIADETQLGYGAFSCCSMLSDVILPEGLESIGEAAFSECNRLEAVSIPGSVSEICASAFSGCSSLESVVVPDGVESIDDNAFSMCENLKSATLGASLAYLGYGAFGYCGKLESVCFLGDAPYAEYDVFDESSKKMVVYVLPGTTGWASGSSSDLPSRWPEYSWENGSSGRRIKFETAAISDGNGGSSGGGNASTGSSSDGNAIGSIALTVTNVVVHYVMNSIRSEAVAPPTTAGIVNVISEVNAGSAVAVTAEWAEQYPGFAAKFGNDFSKAIVAQSGKRDGAGNPMMVWQDFVAGTDPTDESDVFTASITFDAATNEPIVSWTPELSDAEAAKRSYKTYGKVRLTDADWTLLDGDASTYNFFKVTVEMK